MRMAAAPAEDRKPRVYSPGVYLRRVIDLVGLMFLVRFTYKPLRFFGLIGSATAGLGAVILLVLLAQRLSGQGIADRPMLLLGVLLGGLLVLGANVDALNGHAAPTTVDGDDLAGPALVVAGDDQHVVSGADLHQTTSWASETIFM